jgi:MFS family permease
MAAPQLADTRRHGLFAQFAVMGGAVRELWVTFAVKLLGILAYSVMNSTLVLWLSADLGYNDAQAGMLVFGWSALMTLFTVLVGSLTDAIGIRKAFLLGVWVCIFARLVLTFAEARWLAIGLGLVPLALGEALGTPVLVAAVRRYSTTAQRSIAFSLFYAVMNIGFFIAAFIFDGIRQALGEPDGRLTLPILGVELTTYRTLFLASLAVQAVLVPVIYLGIRHGVEATDDGVKITPEIPKYPLEPLGKSLLLTCRDTWRETVRIFGGLWQQPGFYKFLAFLALAAFVRLIFIQMSYTYPKFGIRELGAGAPIGRLYAKFRHARHRSWARRTPAWR